MAITVEKSTLRETLAKIEKMDETLDAQAGSEAAGKKKIATELVSSYEESWTDIAGQVSKHLQSLDEEALVGVYTGIVRNLNETFGEQIDKFLETRMKERKTADAEKLSEEQIEALMEERRNLVKYYGVIRVLLESSDEDVSDIPEPKVRRGSVGKKGPRILSTFDYFVDGEALSDDDNSLTALAKKHNMKGSELKEHLEKNLVLEEGVESFKLKKGEVPNYWTATLPDGKTLTAKRQAEFATEDSAVEDEDENETDAETEEETVNV